MNYEKAIQYNIRKHDEEVSSYKKKHKEIYNCVEQNRISLLLHGIYECYFGSNENVRALDLGCGTGNLTKHLLELGAEVTAADVSPKSLEYLAANVKKNTKLKTLLLNGVDLSQLEDESYDIVCTYSVLHHIPDYLAMVREMARVLKKGGILYIDHEVCPSYWGKSVLYEEYMSELNRRGKAHFFELVWRKIRRLFLLSPWKRIVFEKILRQRMLNEEGDIHVYEDDHIEWSVIRNTLSESFEYKKENDYLVCREENPPDIWLKWKDRVVDMHYIIAQKK